MSVFTIVVEDESIKGKGYILGRRNSLVEARKLAYANIIKIFSPEIEVYQKPNSEQFTLGEMIGKVKNKPIYGGITWHTTTKDGKPARYLLRKNGELGERQL